MKKLVKLFKVYIVQNVKREANETAHLLAKNACLAAFYWVDDYSNFLFSVISGDCYSISV